MFPKLIGFLCLALYAEAKINYFLSMDVENWFQAGINCKAAGMELSSILNHEENDALYNLLTHFNSTTGFWLSGTNLGNGNWYWYSTGTPIIYTNWFPGQPDNGGSPNAEPENCIQWGYVGQNPQPVPNGWNDLRCLDTIPYICQTNS